MKPEEAIKIIQIAKAEVEWEYPLDYQIAFEVVEEALKKQIPKKPKVNHYEEEGEEPYIKICCPNGCRIQLSPVTEKQLAHEHVYCPKCGQKIDWGDEEA